MQIQNFTKILCGLTWLYITNLKDKKIVYKYELMLEHIYLFYIIFECMYYNKVIYLNLIRIIH